ncbi:MAG: hypothetical protein ACXAAO_05435 [Candidatus Thorarchaeota archaeon]
MHARTAKASNREKIVIRTVPPLVEESILLSFGHAVIEFEATLYEKFLRLTNGVVLTCKEFKEHLKNMEAREIIKSTEFIGKRCWARNMEMVETD